MKSFARNRFENILCESLTEDVFMQKMMKLTEENPYFIRAALEIIWLAEKKLDFIFCNSVFKKTLLRINTIYGNSNIRSSLEKEYSNEDLKDIARVFEMSKKPWVKISLISKIVIFLQKKSFKIFFSIRLKRSIKKNEYLKLVGEIDMNPYKDSLKKNSNNALLGKGILFEELEIKRITDEIINKINGENSSSLLIKSSFFTLNLLSQQYRNCILTEDCSIFYYIVLNGESLVTLESGRNTSYAANGEIWFLNHKVMHRIENHSNEKISIMLFEFKQK